MNIAVITDALSLIEQTPGLAIPGSNLAFPKKKFRVHHGVAEIPEYTALNGGQRLDNVDQTHLAAASQYYKK